MYLTQKSSEHLLQDMAGRLQSRTYLHTVHANKCSRRVGHAVLLCCMGASSGKLQSVLKWLQTTNRCDVLSNKVVC